MIPKFLLKRPVPTTLPRGMMRCVEQIDACKTKEQALQTAYDIVTSKYYGDTVLAYTRFYQVFALDLQSLWSRRGFLHAVHMNYILRALLVTSRHFDENDVELRMSRTFGNPHQYLLVHVGKKKYMNVDPWAKALGVPFGDYLHGW